MPTAFACARKRPATLERDHPRFHSWTLDLLFLSMFFFLEYGASLAALREPGVSSPPSVYLREMHRYLKLLNWPQRSPGEVVCAVTVTYLGESAGGAAG